MGEDLIGALENLIKAYHGEGSMSLALERAVDALGYDPSIKDQEYLVSLEIGVVARTPDDAVREFISLLETNPNSAWVYKVTDSDNYETSVDPYYWDK